MVRLVLAFLAAAYVAACNNDGDTDTGIDDGFDTGRPPEETDSEVDTDTVVDTDTDTDVDVFEQPCRIPSSFATPDDCYAAAPTTLSGPEKSLAKEETEPAEQAKKEEVSPQAKISVKPTLKEGETKELEEKKPQPAAGPLKFISRFSTTELILIGVGGLIFIIALIALISVLF